MNNVELTFIVGDTNLLTTISNPWTTISIEQDDHNW